MRIWRTRTANRSANPTRVLSATRSGRIARALSGAGTHHDLPPWDIGYQPTRRWVEAGVFAAIVADLRLLLRVTAGHASRPSAAILESRTLHSTPESGARAGYDRHKRRKDSKVHAVVDTWGHQLALSVTPANEQDRAQVAALAAAVQEATGEHVELISVDQGDTGEQPAADAAAHGIRLEVVKLPQAKRGFVLLPRHWVVERAFALASRFRRLARDYERLAQELVGLHFVAFICLMLHQLIHLVWSP